MAENILGVDKQRKGVSRGVIPWDADWGYRLAGWMGLVLTLAALSDYVLALVPMGFGSPEWEMSTIGAVMQGLPLFSLGLVGLWVESGGFGRRWTLRLVGFAFLASAACILASLVLFLTDVPTAIQATSGLARLGVQKLISKTLVLGLLFGVTYVTSGLQALRQARGSSLKKAAS